ncbi:uncharacterized protein LOC125275914 isoform X3 [Megalobrama amblycephala]|uniref:uncharacterized protein LOC125275914 isoform X3 n=2 Tax=Megalobrama amblycephala TaxID=75352 RepID=UPI002013E450|nr:uncharacterized protein LOC125275914 isoform X3 [Megalobrama amblycephala]
MKKNGFYPKHVQMEIRHNQTPLPDEQLISDSNTESGRPLRPHYSNTPKPPITIGGNHDDRTDKVNVLLPLLIGFIVALVVLAIIILVYYLLRKCVKRRNLSSITSMCLRKPVNEPTVPQTPTAEEVHDTQSLCDTEETPAAPRGAMGSKIFSLPNFAMEREDTDQNTVTQNALLLPPPSPPIRRGCPPSDQEFRGLWPEIHPTATVTPIEPELVEEISPPMRRRPPIRRGCPPSEQEFRGLWSEIHPTATVTPIEPELVEEINDENPTDPSSEEIYTMEREDTDQNTVTQNALLLPPPSLRSSERSRIERRLRRSERCDIEISMEREDTDQNTVTQNALLLPPPSPPMRRRPPMRRYQEFRGLWPEIYPTATVTPIEPELLEEISAERCAGLGAAANDDSDEENTTDPRMEEHTEEVHDTQSLCDTEATPAAARGAMGSKIISLPNFAMEREDTDQNTVTQNALLLQPPRRCRSKIVSLPNLTQDRKDSDDSS